MQDFLLLRCMDAQRKAIQVLHLKEPTPPGLQKALSGVKTVLRHFPYDSGQQ